LYISNLEYCIVANLDKLNKKNSCHPYEAIRIVRTANRMAFLQKACRFLSTCFSRWRADYLPVEPPAFITNIMKKVVDTFWPKEECSGHGQPTAGPPGAACQCEKFYTGHRQAPPHE
jgi:hypothetical protein